MSRIRNIVWESRLRNPDYTTDTGNREGGTDVCRLWGQKTLGNATGPGSIDLKTAFTKMAADPGRPMLLIRTSTTSRYPGAFYAKAFIGMGADWALLKRTLDENQATNKHRVRKAWVRGPGQTW